MNVYTQNPKDSTEKFLETISNFCKVTGYKVYTQKVSHISIDQQGTTGI